mmetsp:Transcript_81149/g.180443  ORF Transcript_81149/g.180443 Transcript_81149/m.180443 type:complete len:246 (+) Transcript_81149:1495-2232(+)
MRPQHLQLTVFRREALLQLRCQGQGGDPRGIARQRVGVEAGELPFLLAKISLHLQLRKQLVLFSEIRLELGNAHLLLLQNRSLLRTLRSTCRGSALLGLTSELEELRRLGLDCGLELATSALADLQLSFRLDETPLHLQQRRICCEGLCTLSCGLLPESRQLGLGRVRQALCRRSLAATAASAHTFSGGMPRGRGRSTGGSTSGGVALGAAEHGLPLRSRTLGTAVVALRGPLRRLRRPALSELS